MPAYCPSECTGKPHRERAAIAANRVGKTEGIGAYEVTLHLTGLYPDWWQGRRFDRPIKAWAAGDTNKTVRNILQEKLYGPPTAVGTGMIPGDLIAHRTLKQGTADAVDTIYVKHASGGLSRIELKSYQAGRESFQGTEQDLIWLDEEPPESIYTECLLRTATTGGMIMLTFTPLSGLSDVVLSYIPGGEVGAGAKFLVTATWDDVPHLSDEVKKELWNSIPAYQRDARTKGIPALGSGAIYPIPESELVIPDHAIPDHWPRAYGMDVGWNRTAGIWAALNRDTDVLTLYSEHYAGEAQPVVHAAAFRARGEWIRGAIDPASRGRGQIDGQKLLDMYRDLGLKVEEAQNAVETGIYQLLTRMQSGRLKVFQSLQNFLAELRLYRRDEKGRIVKERDHLMDATRYLEMSFLDICRTKPVEKKETTDYYGGGTWMS